MEFQKVIEQRRSIRKYRGDPIPPDKLSALYRALQCAPSTANQQAATFHFVNDPLKRREIATRACHNQVFVMEAPVIMVACCKPGFAFDVAIAVDHMILAATNEGLGTCWVGWMEQDIVKQILGIPESLEVPILVPIGYAAENPAPRTRKPLEELIHIQ